MSNEYKIIDSVTLNYNKGNSDKIYEIYLKDKWIDSSTFNYIVTVYYGRRGSILRSLDKFESNCIKNAEAYFEDLVEEKISKGYKDVSNNYKPNPAISKKVKPKPNEPATSVRNIILGDL